MGPQGFPGGGGGFHAGGFSMEDIFSQFGDIFGGGFGNMGGFETAGGRTRRRQRRGSDLRIKVKMTLAEIATGVTKTLKIPTLVKDTHCDGTGCERRHGFHYMSDLWRFGNSAAPTADSVRPFTISCGMSAM